MRCFYLIADCDRIVQSADDCCYIAHDVSGYDHIVQNAPELFYVLRGIICFWIGHLSLVILVSKDLELNFDLVCAPSSGRWSGAAR